MSPAQLLHSLRERAQQTSQLKLARELGVSPTYLNDVLKGRREPGEKILAGLGLRRSVTYRRAV